MNERERVATALLVLRASVFLVMLMWTIDKFVNAQHAAAVYERFYAVGGLGPGSMRLIGAVELIVLLGFALGYQKRLTYGAVLLFHAISTLSSYRQYLNPFEPPNLLFFAAWPMLGACIVLYSLREMDTRAVVGRSKRLVDPSRRS